MYIIYNSDGSIEKKSITEYIQQGNSYANVLFVTVKDTELGDYTASAIVTLPNGQNVGAIIEEAEEPVEIDGVEYNGYYITLDETCTLMAGAIRISLSLTIEETRVVTYPIYLNVNATPYDADAPVMISYNQYLELLASIAEVTTPNNPTITLQKNGVTVGYFSLNQASNKTINYVLSKSDVGLGKVDNTSDATKKSNFTGSIANGNTGFATGGDVYTHCLLTNVNQTISSNKAFSSGSYLSFTSTGTNSVDYRYNISSQYGELYLRKFHTEQSSVLDAQVTWDGENFYPNTTNTQNLGTDEKRWKTVYLKELNFSATLGALGTQTYSFKISGGGDLQLNTTLFQISSGGNLQVPHLSVRKGSTIYSIGIGDDDILSIAQFHFNKESGHEAFYHEIGSYYDTVWGPADLGTSTYPWKDLYLSGNVNIGGKINDLTIPSSKFPQNKGTIALKEDMSPIIVEAGVTPAKIKEYTQGTPADHYKIYLADATTWTDITSEYQNGDYDSLTISNSIFNSSNKEVNIYSAQSDYLAFRIAGVNGYFIAQRYKLFGQIMSWSGRTIVVIDDGLPNRVCVGGICYKC